MSNVATSPVAPVVLYKIGHVPATRAVTQNNNAFCWSALAAHIAANGPSTKASLLLVLSALNNGAYVGYAIRRKWLVAAS